MKKKIVAGKLKTQREIIRELIGRQLTVVVGGDASSQCVTPSCPAVAQ